tara:strand:+ start:137 stop:355 length:219 start_codon:yes stop_codon:yes gene_type:complete
MNSNNLNTMIDKIFLNIINDLNIQKENLLNELSINNINKQVKILDKKNLNGITYYYDKENNIKYDTNGNIIN